MFVQVALIVFRESFEAVLIIGLLNSIVQSYELSLKQIWMFRFGIFAGLLSSAILGWGLYKVSDFLDGKALDFFQISLLTIGAVLITHMCLWMRKHARNLKSEYQQKIKKQIQDGTIWGLTALAAIAILREGIETVLFLLGMIGQDGMFSVVIQGAVVGLAAGLISYVLIRKGAKWIKPHILFPVTTVFLLFTASGFLAMAARGAIQSELVSGLMDPVWDSSFLIDDSSWIGSTLNKWMGYQSQPALTTVLVIVAYWITTLSLFYYQKKSGQPKPA